MSLHSGFVHFPIALLSFAVVQYFLSLKFSKFKNSAFISLLTGTALAFPTLLTGSIDEEKFAGISQLHSILETHEMFAFLTVVVFGISSLIAIYCNKKRRNLPWIFYILLIIGIGFLTATGVYGAKLVFGS